MNFTTMLGELIEEEISKIEQNGVKVKLKTLLRKRIIYTLFFGGLFAILLVAGNYLLAFVNLAVYFIVLYNLNNVSVISVLAKRSPDKPIADIIRGDMK